HLFLDRPGELITKSEIMDAVWPNMAVEESNLTVQMSALRRALGGGRDGARYIQTVPGRGYRFTPRVDEFDARVEDTNAAAATRGDVSARVLVANGMRAQQAVAAGSPRDRLSAPPESLDALPEMIPPSPPLSLSAVLPEVPADAVLTAASR